MRRLIDDAAVAALESDVLVPPSRPASFPAGPTAELRDAMARFSRGDDHRTARADVERAIAALDLALLAREVTERTTTATATATAGNATARNATAGTRGEAIGDIGFVVPTEALLAVLQVPSADVLARAADVRTVVGAIGRFEPVSPDTEAATRRLVGCFAEQPAGHVAAISMLYQNHDATAALFASTLLARSSRLQREHALALTVRIATEATTVGDEAVEAGELVEVSLDGDRLEFGHGDHACPGQSVAVLIVDAMIAALELLDVQVDINASTVGPDGRAVALVVGA